MTNICTYIPVSILNYLQQLTSDKQQSSTLEPIHKQHTSLDPPIQHSYETVVMFADVSGYTAMCEAMASQGPGGEEYLAKNLNSYFELLVRAMSSQGGDVFKFAGDAVLVIWPPSEEKLDLLVRRAVQCGLQVSDTLQDAVLSHGVRLSVKIGIGAGEVTLLHLGGVYKRLEYLAVGDPLVQAFHAEHHATKTELVVSPDAWKLVERFFDAEVNEDKYAFVTGSKEPIPKKCVYMASVAPNDLSDDVLKLVQHYIPTAILAFAAHNDDKWINELRCVTVLFVNLGMEEKELIAISGPNNSERVQRVHHVLRAVQLAVYKFEGSLNKFLMDDKGSTLIAVFGLPPLAHADDTPRAVLAALQIQQDLQQFELRPSIGITTGNAFCGVVGNKGRREYSILGDTVNLAARLMQHAASTGAGVICDRATEHACAKQASHWHDLCFFRVSQIQVKGKTLPVEIMQPILKQTPSHPAHSALFNKMRKLGSALDFNGDAELQHCQEIVTSLCNSKLPKGENLVYSGSACAVVQSEPGMGKTKLLLAIGCKYHGDDNVEVVFGAGCPYDINTPLRAWSEILDVLFHLCQITNPRSYVRKLMDQKGERDELVPCLNQTSHWNFEESEESIGLDAAVRLEKALTFMVMILEDMINLVLKLRHRGVLILIEDAESLDHYSWLMCHRVIRDTSNVILLLATRPLDTTYLGPFAKPNLIQGFTELKLLPQCVVVSVSPRTEQMIYKLAAQALQVALAQPATKKYAFAGALGRFIIEKARGNPLYVNELMNHFLSNDHLTIEFLEDHYCKVSSRTLYPSGADKKQVLAKQQQEPRKFCCPLPVSITCELSSRLDRLSLAQQHIIKVAAVIGNEFSMKLLIQSYFLESENKDIQLATEMAGLVALKIFTIDSTADDEVVGDVKYCFVNGCLRDVALSRLMESHQAQFIQKIRQVDSTLFQQVEEKQKSSEFPKSFQDSIIEGHLKQVGGTAKSTQYFVLFRDKLLCYSSSDTSRGPKGEILIGHETTVQIDPDPKSANFVLISGGTKGRNELIAKDKEDATRWVEAIYKLTLEKAAKKRDTKSKSVLSRNTTGPDGFRYSQIVRALGTDQPADRVFSESIKEGYLMKSGGKIRTWKKRYFILFQDKLIYYEAAVPNLAPALLARQAPDKLQVKGEIPLSAKTAVEADPELKATFRVAPELGGRKFVVAAPDEKVCEEWVHAIKEVCSKQVQATRVLEANAKMANHSVMEGVLRKKGGKFGNWSTRYFVLFNNKMQYFSEKDKKMTGEFLLWRETEVGSDPDKTLLLVKSDPHSKLYVLGAKDEEEALAWSNAIKAQCKQAPKKDG